MCWLLVIDESKIAYCYEHRISPMELPISIGDPCSAIGILYASEKRRSIVLIHTSLCSLLRFLRLQISLIDSSSCCQNVFGLLAVRQLGCGEVLVHMFLLSARISGYDESQRRVTSAANAATGPTHLYKMCACELSLIHI